MAGFEQNRASFDGSINGGYGSKPRVNLPPMPVQRSAAPRDGLSAASAEPNSMSLNNYFPSLPATPRVNLPTRQTHSPYIPNTPQSVAPQNNLEAHLRGMILSNGISDGPIPLQTNATASTGYNPRGSRRPNQAQRRQEAARSNGNVPYNAPSSGQHPTPLSRANTNPVLPTTLRKKST